MAESFHKQSESPRWIGGNVQHNTTQERFHRCSFLSGRASYKNTFYDSLAEIAIGRSKINLFSSECAMRFTIQKCTTSTGGALWREFMITVGGCAQSFHSMLLHMHEKECFIAAPLPMKSFSLFCHYKSDICESNCALFHSNRASSVALSALFHHELKRFPLHRTKIIKSVLISLREFIFKAFSCNKTKQNERNHKNN